MEDKKIRIAITHGDTNGIGYEIIFKTFADPAILELCTPIIYGSPKVAAYHRKSLNMQANFSIISKAEDARDDRVNILTCFDEEVKVELGVATKASAAAAQKALLRAVQDYQQGLFDALVTTPAILEVVSGEETVRESQQRCIERALGHDGKSLTIHINGGLRIASVTGEKPLGDALREIRKDLIVEKATVFHNSLRRDFRLSNPRIALLQVNPQSGAEEEEILKPAVTELHNAGIGVFGPYPADDYFSHYEHTHFDGTLAMYHGQAITPLRMLAEEGRIELTTGLPIVHTAPGMGPSYEIAGQGVADESQLRNAIYLAIDTCRYRAEYDEPTTNPLKKLYHEKRDDSEKVRFSIPKKNEAD